MHSRQTLPTELSAFVYLGFCFCFESLQTYLSPLHVELTGIKSHPTLPGHHDRINQSLGSMAELVRNFH